MTLRIAFDGYNELAAKAYGFLHEMGGDIEFAGWVGELPDVEWSKGVPTPPRYPDLDSLLRDKSLDILFSTRGEEARRGSSYKGNITNIGGGSPENAFLAYLTSVREADDEHLRQVLRDISTFYESVQVVDAYTDPLPKLTEVLVHAIKLCGADVGFVLLPGELPGELDMVVADGKGAAHPINRSVRVAGSILDAVMELGKSLSLKLSPEDFDTDEFLREAGVKSLMAVPLKMSGRAAGVLLVGRRNEDGFMPYLLGVLTVAATQASLALQISQLYGKLESNITRDAVSGLFNQYFFLSRLAEEVNRARRYSLVVCLVVLELDGFDQYERNNGSALADLALSDLGNAIRKSTREVDVPARIGESRFAVLLPETRRLGAMRLAERLRQVVEDYPFPAQKGREAERLTACVGVASFPASAENDTVLLEKAVLAMEAAQAAGPDQVRLFSDDLR